MKKTILEFYGLAVCFLAIIFVVTNLSEGIYNLIRISAPELTLYAHTYERHQSNERFKQKWGKKKKRTLSDEQVTKLRLDSLQIELTSESRLGFQKLTKNLIYLTISSIVLWIHWRIASKARKTTSADT